jgi:hypothetical protein
VWSAKLYYLRDLRGKKARIKERRIDEAKLAAMEAMRAEDEAMGAAAEEGSMEALEEAETAAELDPSADGEALVDGAEPATEEAAEVGAASEDGADPSADEAGERAEA